MKSLTAKHAKTAKRRKGEENGYRRSGKGDNWCCKLRLGYLLNFNVPVMKDGIKRVVNDLQHK
jgi:hypothetical protein